METIYATMEGNMERKQDIVNTLASNIKFLRINTKVEQPTGKIKYMTQKDFAQMIGSIEQQISKFELAKNEMSASQIFKISRIFDVSVDKLFDAELIKSDYNKVIKNDIYI